MINLSTVKEPPWLQKRLGPRTRRAEALQDATPTTRNLAQRASGRKPT